MPEEAENCNYVVYERLRVVCRLTRSKVVKPRGLAAFKGKVDEFNMRAACRGGRVVMKCSF